LSYDQSNQRSQERTTITSTTTKQEPSQAKDEDTTHRRVVATTELLPLQTKNKDSDAGVAEERVSQKPASIDTACDGVVAVIKPATEEGVPSPLTFQSLKKYCTTCGKVVLEKSKAVVEKCNLCFPESIVNNNEDGEQVCLDCELRSQLEETYCVC